MAIYIDDRELVAAHRAGDGEAFEERVREHRRSLLAHARRKLSCSTSAEDALQETLMRAYKSLPNFDGEYRLGPWLHRIMHNVCADEASRRRRDGEKTDSFAAQPVVRKDAPSIEDELGLGYDDAELTDALKELPESHREALLLRFVDDLNYDQVAKVSGVSEQNARARVSRARTAMRVALKGVAVVPSILFGVLRRGEKAAAAAVTSTSGAASVSASSAVSSAVSAPAITEVAVAVAQSAPAAVPVITKAAVGIGLAAAVLTPTSDSAVHYAVESIATSNAGVTVEQVVDKDIAVVPLDDAVLIEESSRNESISDSYSPIETISPSIEVPVETAGQSSIQGQDSLAKATISAGSLGALVEAEFLEISPIGADRYALLGKIQLVVDSKFSEGALSPATWLRLEKEADSDGRRRMDGLLDLQLNDGTSLTIRLAGFAAGEQDILRVAGLYRIAKNTMDLSEAGSFNGSISMRGTSDTFALTFTP